MGTYTLLIGKLVNAPIGLFSILLFTAAFICIELLIPIVVWVSFQKRLVTPVNNRSSHQSITPPFGGVAFYMVFIISISLLQLMLGETTGYNIIAAISVLFMIGLKDDLVHSTPRVKLLAQLLSCFLIVGCEKFDIGKGLSSTFEFSCLLPILFSILLMILIINSYNLIDGIDGLAAMTGIVSCTVYALLFYHNRDQFFFFLAIITLGILGAFLRFNLSGKNRKIFMGDCGSLTIGLILGLCTLRFLAMETHAEASFGFTFESKVLMVGVILFIPFLDTSRIIIIRLKTRRKLFEADKKHIHHVLVGMGLSHAKTSLILSLSQSIIIVAAISMSGYVNETFMFAIIAGIYGIAGYLFFKIAGLKVCI